MTEHTPESVGSGQINKSFGYIATDTITGKTVSAGSGNGTADTIRIEPHEDALRNGYLVGQSARQHIVLDPRDYASDAAAIQACHDDLTALLDASGPDSVGCVWIPPLRPDGSQFVVGSTVTFEGDGVAGGIDVFPRGWGFNSQYAPWIQCGIDDGSPMFHIRGMRGQNTYLGGFNIDGGSGGTDAEAIRMVNCQAWVIRDIQIRRLGGTAQAGCIVLDSEVWNSFVDNIRYGTHQTSLPESVLFAFRDSTGNGPPGEIKYGMAISTYADPAYPFKHAFHCDVGVSSIHITGRYEGYGDNGIHFTSGSVFLGDGLELGRVEDIDGTGTHQVYFTGYEISMNAGIEMNTNDTGAASVYLEPDRGKIESFTAGDPSGGAINIPTDTGANILVVPREQTFTADCSYPSTFNQLVYHDGWEREATGSVTVPTGGSVQLGNWLAKPTQSLRVNTRLPDPGEDIFFAVEKGFSTGNEQTIRIVDKQSTADYTVNYEVEQKQE